MYGVPMKGRFRPKNPTKYKGNPTNIIYRSSYELKAMMKLDSNPNVKCWSSEEFFVPYRSPLDGKIHRYFPDLFVENRDGSKFLFEIKPSYQTLPPMLVETKRKTLTKASIKAQIEWSKNNAKWEAAKTFCEQRGWIWQILTERELNIPVKIKQG